MKIKLTAGSCLCLAGAFCLLAAAHSEQAKTTTKKPWPRDRDDTQAVEGAKTAFTAALTRSAKDRKFRERLTASCDSAREEVIAEGNIDIPEDVVVMFYEPKTYEDHFAFYLPPLDTSSRTPYKYTDDRYFQCCSTSFRKFLVQTINPTLATALNAALTRAGYDPDFRKSLTVSCDSAKKAVSDEGHVEIKSEISMIFHDGEDNEKYHVFSLPKFGETDASELQYRKQFMCCYNVW
jgi:hypothetical protein